MTRAEAHQLVDYTFDRPVGELAQEVGGVLVTLAALCDAQSVEMKDAAENELFRCWHNVDKIRAKQAAKPKHSPLPEATNPAEHPVSAASDERLREAATGVLATIEYGALWDREADRNFRDSHTAACLRAALATPPAASQGAGVPDGSELARLTAENADLRISVVGFGALWMVPYAKAHGLPDGHLFAEHYDILARAGARMDDFTRAPAPRDGREEV